MGAFVVAYVALPLTWLTVVTEVDTVLMGLEDGQSEDKTKDVGSWK